MYNNNIIFNVSTYIFSFYSSDNAEQSKRNELKQQLANFQEKLNELEALLRTKKAFKMQLENDEMRLLKEIQSSKLEINSCENRMRKYYIIAMLVKNCYILISVRLNNFTLFKKKLSEN